MVVQNVPISERVHAGSAINGKLLSFGKTTPYTIPPDCVEARGVQDHAELCLVYVWCHIEATVILKICNNKTVY